MKSFFEALKKNIEGEVRFDPLTKKIYSVDASIYEVEPLGIVIPKTKHDLVTALQLAVQYTVPVIARGAATGITGACLGKGLIIDTSKYLNKIIDINIPEEYAICEPGVIQDQLNASLYSAGYRLGPDTSTGNRATLGGMLANNAAGARSLHYGTMADHVEMVELALTKGEIISCLPINNQEWEHKRQLNNREGAIYSEIYKITTDYHDAIEKNFPKIPRRASGYNLDNLLSKPHLNLSKLVAGSEGTLGIATQIKMKIAKKPRYTGLCVIHSDNMIHGLYAVQHLLKEHPLALEMIDDKILAAARLSPNIRDKIGWLSGTPQAVFVAEFEGASPDEVKSKLERCRSAAASQKAGYAILLLQEPRQIDHVWEVRKAGLGLLLSKRSYSRAIAFIEDLSISPEKLASFMDQFSNYLRGIGKDAGIYGHVGPGCIHIRPYIDLRKEGELELMKKIMDDVSTMVLEHGGAMSGEHGDGLIRSWLNEKMFGKEIYQAFCQVKRAFDPHHLMNPGKIVNAPPPIQDLRLSPDSTILSIPTFLDFSPEGGFELAADLCNGNGECRKSKGVMCPSFQATQDEFHTTRARAQSLRAIIHGRLPLQELTGKSMFDVLDLCIECKGCKRECPSQVDMAKMKAEFLFQYQEKHGYSWRNKLFAHIHGINRLNFPFSRIFNALSSTKIAKAVLSWIGLSPKRDLPHLSHERFSKWFKQQQQSSKTKKVALFNDTYTEYNQPDIGKAAFKILSELGYEILLINGPCCGRPLISKGFLNEAKENAQKVVQCLYEYTFKGIHIIGLEPSCISALRDDFKGLIGQNDKLSPLLQSVIEHSASFDEFLHRHLQDGRLPLEFKQEQRHVLVHGHCHQKSLVGSKPTLEVLNGIEGFIVSEIESGCCGLAGAFGYEKEHYDISMQIGNLHLLPAVRNAPKDAIIVASGISCRSQIEHGAHKQALHLAEAIELHMA